MLRILIAAAAAVALAGSAQAGLLDAGTTPNKFIVTYSIVPDPTHSFNFYNMPRTIKEAENDHFTQVSANDVDSTTLWCRKNDFRVCVYFDKQGSVAGIQISVRVSEIDTAKNAPLDILAIPEWRRQTLLGEDVYSTVAYFQSREELQSGGRSLSEDTHTAPNGLYILQTNEEGVETGLLHVATAQSEAEAAGFYEQACFFGMGKHYYQNLKKDGTCEAHRPYFLLFGPKTKQLQGFGFVQYGKVSQGRGWFENPPALVSKIIKPNSPECLTKWIKSYGQFGMHVYFVDKPYFTRC
ncbi:uncharacterized protein LOC117643171 [Thrips palmi]|uniref:Uncharacterized protein LOC117643171 n=1 Tax=Thrips palmi TaxID=161013 RepID=A0A6P8YL54_THRPL|nr:uncharacterized protein LOC117643171 [Thrips palmi]